MLIDTDYYYQQASHLNTEEKLCRQNLTDRIPSRIYDIHTHLGRKEDGQNLAPDLYGNMITSYISFTEEQHRQISQKLWPAGIDYKQSAFGFPFRGIDIHKSNEYVLTISERNKKFIPFLTGDPEDIHYTTQELVTGKWKGIKMYAQQLTRTVNHITDFFPEAILEQANHNRTPIILHLPHNIQTDAPELTYLATRYKSLPFIVAHFGMARGNLHDIEEAFRSTTYHDNIFYDTSWFDNEYILKRGLEIIGPGKILYASDQPFNLIRAEFVTHPILGERIATDQAYHWADLEEQQYYHQIMGFNPAINMNFHFKGLQILVSAVENIYPRKSEQVKDRIFYQNAESLIPI